MNGKKLERLIPVLMCRDVAASIRYYTERLGFAFVFQDTPDNPRYAGVRRDAVELHLQWQDEAQWRPAIDRPNYRIYVQDVDGLHAELAPNAERMTAIMDTDWGTREFHVQDPDKNGLQFFRPRD